MERIVELVNAGMDVARLNLSHGTYAEHEEIYHRVRQAADDAGHGVGVFVDLQGPKIRLGHIKEGSTRITTGQSFTITTRELDGNNEIASTTYQGLPGDVSAGDQILIDDGKVRLRVTEVEGTNVHTQVVTGGRISDHKGINLPGVPVSVPAMSEKDIEDLRWGLRLGVDFIALSFVRSAADVEDVRKIMREEGVLLPVIAKIEKPQAIDNLDEIVKAFDGFMVARGDLGVECPLEDVPFLQKRVVEKARRNAKPVIVATQMLESMISSPSPTRAEASDVANAVLDGADAVMLSGETSVGEYPIAAVRTMERIIDAVESDDGARVPELVRRSRSRSGAIVRAAKDVGETMDVRALATFTQTGDTARRLASLHPRQPLLAFTVDARVRSQLALSWGVETFLVPSVQHTDDMVRQVDFSLLSIGRLREGDRVVVVAGSPPNTVGSTNLIRVPVMGDAINEAAPAYHRR